MPLAALTIAIACYIAFWPIRFRNCRMQNSDARLVFEERKFCHITPLLRAPPPHFYTFEAPPPPLPHFYRLPPPTPHFYCFPSNTTTTFHCFPPPPTRTHTISTFLLFSIHHLHHNCFHCTTISTTFRLFSLHHHLHLHHNSIVFRPQPQHMYFLCFPSTIFTTTSFLLFFIHNLQHISMVSHALHSPHFYCFPAPLPPPHSYCFPSITTTTFLLFSIHHLNHISIVFPAPPPPHFYCFPLPPPSIPDFKTSPS